MSAKKRNSISEPSFTSKGRFGPSFSSRDKWLKSRVIHDDGTILLPTQFGLQIRKKTEFVEVVEACNYASLWVEKKCICQETDGAIEIMQATGMSLNEALNDICEKNFDNFISDFDTFVQNVERQPLRDFIWFAPLGVPLSLVIPAKEQPFAEEAIDAVFRLGHDERFSGDKFFDFFCHLLFKRRPRLEGNFRSAVWAFASKRFHEAFDEAIRHKYGEEALNSYNKFMRELIEHKRKQGVL